jgi:uncharacterized protein (TIGR03790 family)
MHTDSQIAGAVRRWVGLLTVAVAARGWGEERANQTVVLANQIVPASVELARHYIQARSIPESHLCVLDLPSGEIISRGFFEDRLREPLLEFLRGQKLIEQVPRNPKNVLRHESPWTTISSSVRYVVSMYGVPLRIADTRLRLAAYMFDRARQMNEKDSASVDSELALLLFPGYEIGGPHLNPAYGGIQWSERSPAAQWMLVAARLDGPDPGTVRRMIDDALWAERYGLLGRAYFDGRGITNSGGYQMGDYWIDEAWERFLREGYECSHDDAEPMWGTAYPMENAVVYMGWYAETMAGPFTRADFRFRRGAVAYHIHSSSATRLRSSSEYWAGPLLARGAAATMGAVSEPFLSFTPQLQLFADRLCRGETFGESAYLSQASVSWQITVVGDPLYDPFRYSLDQQIENLEKDGLPDVEWAYVRKVNLLVREGALSPALDYCRRKLEQRDSLVLRERLGDLYARNELLREAAEQYERVATQAVTAETAVRVGAHWLIVLKILGRTDEAARREAELREKWKDSPVVSWLDTAKP